MTETADTISIDLDRKHLARRTRTGWELCRKDDNGIYRTLKQWDGPRKSIFTACDHYGVVPSRAAEEQINALPEHPAFRDDGPRRGQMPTLAV